MLVPGTVSHVELYWELPANQYLLKRLAAFSRVIVFDKRGQGLSDRVGDQTLEERVDDVLAVMNAAASERATIYGWSEGGQLSLTLAAMHPERVSGLVLYGTYAAIKLRREPWERFLAKLENHWGEGVLVDVNAPSRRDDRAFVEWFGRLERAVASPGSIWLCCGPAPFASCHTMKRIFGRHRRGQLRVAAAATSAGTPAPRRPRARPDRGGPAPPRYRRASHRRS